MKNLAILLLIIAVCALSGCDSSPTGDEQNTTPRLISGSALFPPLPILVPDKLVDFDSTIQVSVSKIGNNFTSSPDSVYVVVLKTDRIYGCINFSILQTAATHPGLIDLRLYGVFIEDICLTALGPAVATSAYDMRDGTYTLRVRYKDSTDEYRLTVAGGVITASAIQTSFSYLGP